MICAISRAGWLLGVGTILFAQSALATVSLIYTDKDSAPTSGTYTINSSFTLSVQIVTAGNPATQVDGVDYDLDASTSNIFQLQSRTVPADSPFDSAYDPSPPKEYLSPNTHENLGAIESSGGTTTGAGTYSVSNFIIAIPPSAAPGKYTLSFVLQQGSTLGAPDYVGAAPTYNSSSFDTLGTYAVTVVAPEPAAAIILPCVGLLGIRSRRRTARAG